MHFLYILHSSSANKFYVGETDNIDSRLLKHNNHSYDGSFTKIAEDWRVVLQFECVSKHQALQLEKFIKKMKSKIFIQKTIINPEILTDIISKNNF
ncbi:MAG: GIY-YIG nuclease family protein [Flavobacterium sp.]|nr:GIY-YIG nuclease family protein [Flavobacterium sp.]